MNNRQEFFKTCYHVKTLPLPQEYNECDVTPLINQEEVSVLCPTNEFGLVGDVLQRALSAECTPQMRDNLLGLLSDMSQPSDSCYLSLPDDVKMNLVKLRTCQTPSEMHSYIQALSGWFESNNVKDDPTPNVNDPTPNVADPTPNVNDPTPVMNEP